MQGLFLWKIILIPFFIFCACGAKARTSSVSIDKGKGGIGFRAGTKVHRGIQIMFLFVKKTSDWARKP